MAFPKSENAKICFFKNKSTHFLFVCDYFLKLCKKIQNFETSRKHLYMKSADIILQILYFKINRNKKMKNKNTKKNRGKKFN